MKQYMFEIEIQGWDRTTRFLLDQEQYDNFQKKYQTDALLFWSVLDIDGRQFIFRASLIETIIITPEKLPESD